MSVFLKAQRLQTQIELLRVHHRLEPVILGANCGNSSTLHCPFQSDHRSSTCFATITVLPVAMQSILFGQRSIATTTQQHNNITVRFSKERPEDIHLKRPIENQSPECENPLSVPLHFRV